MSHTKHSRFTTIPLSDADLFIQLLKKPLFLQHLQCRDQIPVAGTAGFHFLHGIRKLHNLSGYRHPLIRTILQKSDICFGNI